MSFRALRRPAFLFLLPAIVGVILVCSPHPVSAQVAGMGRGTPDNPVTRWPVANPDSLGLNQDALDAHAAECLDSEASICMVFYRGYQVQQWTHPDFPTRIQPWIGTRSAVKSLLGLLTGILVSDGSIGSVDDPVGLYLPEWKAGAEGGVTVRHLLTMTAGLQKWAGSGRGHPGVVAMRNTTAFVLDLPLDWEPGTRWEYSNEGAQLLSPLLENAAGMPLAAFARERLLDPLGMASSAMMVDEYYNTVTIGGMDTRAEEFARLGQLILNEGDWNGQQLVSKEWIHTMLTPSPQNAGYGMTWWLHEDGAVSAAGTFDQILYVFPDLDLVTIRLQRDVGPGVTGRYWRREVRDLIRTIVPDH